jgi:hypothetical protein
VSTYVQTAMQRWPGKVIKGDDRFAVVHGDDVYLFDPTAQARNVRLGWDDARDSRLATDIHSQLPRLVSGLNGGRHCEN